MRTKRAKHFFPKIKEKRFKYSTQPKNVQNKSRPIKRLNIHPCSERKRWPDPGRWSKNSGPPNPCWERVGASAEQPRRTRFGSGRGEGVGPSSKISGSPDCWPAADAEGGSRWEGRRGGSGCCWRGRSGWRCWPGSRTWRTLGGVGWVKIPHLIRETQR